MWPWVSCVAESKLCSHGQAVWPWASCVAVDELCGRGQAVWPMGKLYVAGEVLCRWRGAMSLANCVAVASCAAVGSAGCLGGAWRQTVDESGTCPARYVTRPERQLRVAFQLDIPRQVEEILVDNIEYSRAEDPTQRRRVSVFGSTK